MRSTASVITWLILFSGGFALASVLYARRVLGGLEDYVIARNSQNTLATMATLLASTLGGWILFSPAQAAAWGGIGAVLGYAIGAMSPRLAMIPLGKRMREVMPAGHSLTEFIMARYGRGMYGLTLAIMLFYLFIALSAEITAIAKLVTLIAPVPLWQTAAIVMAATLIYTSYGGLRASIFTDKVQVLVILPLLGVLFYFGWKAAGGVMPTIDALRLSAPQMLSFTDPVGIKAGLTFFVAILLTGLFHQGAWQRIYASRDAGTVRNGFLFGGLMVMPFIFIMGLFGLAFKALVPNGDSSVAVFALIMPHIPDWFAFALIPLGLALVMSTADSAISAVSSLIAIDLGRLLPNATSQKMMQLSRSLIVLLAIPVMIVAAQGYSVLYLFLLADLLCSAAAFPVFYGLFSKHHNGMRAVVGTAFGLVTGLLLFPAPGEKPVYLLESFLVATFVPAVVILLMQAVAGKKAKVFEFATLAAAVRKLDR